MAVKVLMFGWEFPPFNSGGLGTACLGLTKGLTSQGIEIIFVLPKKLDLKSDTLKIKFAEPKIKLRFKTVDSLLSPYLNSQTFEKVNTTLKKGLYHSSLMDEVYRYSLDAIPIIESSDFDIIHAHDWMSFKAGIEAKKISGKPLIVHIHSTEYDRTGGSNLNPEIVAIEKEGMEKADRIIAVSDYTRQMITRFYNISPQKIDVVHNGIETGEYESDNEEETLLEFKKAGLKIVLFVGRITLQKGPDYFLKAAKKVLDFNPNVIFVVAGSGDMEYQIINEAATLGISDKVLFAGFLRGKELNRLYKMADLFVMPSVSEPFGIAALESVVNGTPVLVSKQSGVSEAVKHMLSVDFWDTDEMANKILAVINYDSLKLTLQENSFDAVKNLTWNSAAIKCIGVYKDLLNNYFQKN